MNRHTDTKPRILVIEDHASTSKILRLILTRSGFDVEITGNGEEGLQVAQKENFDLILSDVDLPGINGFEICRQLKQDTRLREIPIIMMSGRLAEEYQSKAFKSGAADYLSKPFAPSELLHKISTHVKKRPKTP